jgi:hypothetical protein
MDQAGQAEDVSALGDARAAQVVQADRAADVAVIRGRSRSRSRSGWSVELRVQGAQVVVGMAVNEAHALPRDGRIDPPEGAVPVLRCC